MGVYGIGRPSCRGAVEETARICRDSGLAAVVVADNDGPGIEGAVELCRAVRGKLAVLPTKDTREFVLMGGDRDQFEAHLVCAREV
jgi:hypothetical protein